ncbi:MAG: amidohydrolase family protein, partial [Albidovulum sp.]
MTTRRDLLVGGLVTVSLSGCVGGAEDRDVNPDGLPAVPVDIHNHIFNATDVPIAMFATQVLLRDPETPVQGGPSLARSLVRLIVDIVLAARQTPTASQELAELSGREHLAKRDGGDLLAQDRRAVESGLRVLEDKVDTAGRRRELARTVEGVTPRANGDEVLFSRLANESGVAVNPVGTNGHVRRLGDEPGAKARQIAAAVYRDDVSGGQSTFKTLADRPNPDQSFAQTLRWAGLLTRSRVDILGELIRLYGHQSTTAKVKDSIDSNGIRVFSPSLVDFTYWLRAGQDRDADRSGHDILDQMALMSRMALLERGTLLMPFAPFCPLRAALYRKEGDVDWLKKFKDAVEAQGFAGIKLYPPMGFLPLGNAKFDLPGVPKPRAMQELGVMGEELDHELSALYDWCVAEDVPIKSHGNNSLGADACTGQNAAAENWKLVLETPNWSTLRLNIAHFGGFEEERFEPNPDCTKPTGNYEEQATELISRYDNVYVDLGYWTDVTGSNRKEST